MEFWLRCQNPQGVWGDFRAALGVQHGQSVKGSGLIRLGAPGPPGTQASCKKHHPTKGRRCGDPSTGGPCRFSIVSVTPLPSPLAQVGVNFFPFLLTAPLALKASPHSPSVVEG